MRCSVDFMGNKLKFCVVWTFMSHLFSIVSEAGASVYSASDEAQKELPDLDIAVRGAGE